jgi:predicted hydrocarbon binding protein
MSGSGNKVIWDMGKGHVNLVGDVETKRVFIIREGFMQGFVEEIINVAGKVTLAMILRKTLEKLGIIGVEKPNWDSFKKYNDEQILPVKIEETNIPDFFKWDGVNRDLISIANTDYNIWTVESLQKFKEAMTDVLTERGSSAILHSVTKRGAMAVGNKIISDYGWDDLDASMATMDGVFKFSFTTMGWGQSRAIAQRGNDGNYVIFSKYWNSFEAAGKKSSLPICNIMRGFLEGIAESLGSTLAGQASESREVKCVSMGDKYCAFVVKLKQKLTQALDWKEFEEEWQALDAVDLKPE